MAVEVVDYLSHIPSHIEPGCDVCLVESDRRKHFCLVVR